MFDDLYLTMQNKWYRFQHDESGVEGIVVAVLLIIVAIAAAFLFKDQIGELINDWFEEAKVDPELGQKIKKGN